MTERAHEIEILLAAAEKRLEFKREALAATAGRNPDLGWVREILEEIAADLARIRAAAVRGGQCRVQAERDQWKAKFERVEEHGRTYAAVLAERDALRAELRERAELLREAADMLVHRDTDAADALVREIRAALAGTEG